MHIEVPNLVSARLRKHYPESFRMARRVSSLLKISSRFRRFGIDDETEADTRPRNRGRQAKSAWTVADPPSRRIEDEVGIEAVFNVEEREEPAAAKIIGDRRGRIVNQVFGLREWPPSKPMADSGHFAELLKSVPMRRRDIRRVGRSGSSQLILSNPGLEALMIDVLVAIDSPSDVRTLRQLVLSRIPLQDYNLASLDEELRTGNGTVVRRDPSDSRETPEGALLRGERNREAAEMADQFLISLRRAVNNKPRRFARLLSTLWHCYYDPAGPSQLEIADMLGVSDSLVSDNRRLIECELKKLKLSREDGPVFSESLQQLIGQATLTTRHFPRTAKACREFSPTLICAESSPVSVHT